MCYIFDSSTKTNQTKRILVSAVVSKNIIIYTTRFWRIFHWDFSVRFLSVEVSIYRYYLYINIIERRRHLLKPYAFNWVPTRAITKYKILFSKIPSHLYSNVRCYDGKTYSKTSKCILFFFPNSSFRYYSSCLLFNFFSPEKNAMEMRQGYIYYKDNIFFRPTYIL